MIHSILFFYLLKFIIAEDDVYKSPCESVNITNKNNPSDCYGKSTEYIEETCCYLESMVKDKETNEIIKKYEYVDFTKSDYDVPEQKQIAIEQIKNGTYWDAWNDTYEQIISLQCESNFIFLKGFTFFLLFIL